MIVEKMLENNESRTSMVSTQRSLENSRASPDFSKSYSNVESLKNKALLKLSPKVSNKNKSSNQNFKASKPPLAPGNNVTVRNTEMQNIRISEDEIIQEESEVSESNYEVVQGESLQEGKKAKFNSI